MIKQMGVALTLTQMELSILASGRMTNSMDRAWSHGLTVLCMTVNMKRGRNTEKES